MKISKLFENANLQNDEKALAALWKRYHLATGKEKEFIKKGIRTLEKRISEKKVVKRIVNGVEVIQDPRVFPDIKEMNSSISFAVLKSGTYGHIGKYIVKFEKDEFLKFKGLNHVEMGYEILKNKIEKDGKPYSYLDLPVVFKIQREINSNLKLLGRYLKGVAYTWDSLNDSDVALIKKNFKQLKTIYEGLE